MTKQEYENKIKDLEKQIEELKMAKVEEPQSKKWEPKFTDDIILSSWEDDKIDAWRYLTGNCFKTKEEAEEYKKQIEYTARYKNYIEEHSEPLDWSDDNKETYCGGFNYITHQVDTNWTYQFKNQGVIYASSGQIIRDAIKEIGEDNFKKYVLGVK